MSGLTWSGTLVIIFFKSNKE
uniref:Uncharacterized protein n=1 Tax=Anguilla anguilla TaxID=7936 RepID=A0A0E9XSN9_ANGAN